MLTEKGENGGKEHMTVCTHKNVKMNKIATLECEKKGGIHMNAGGGENTGWAENMIQC